MIIVIILYCATCNTTTVVFINILSSRRALSTVSSINTSFAISHSAALHASVSSSI